MPSGSVRRVSREDIQLVQNLIERCLQLYMNQKEVVDTLLDQAKIEPDFTSLVWQKLEEENQEFFKAYYLRLLVKQQIVEFNRLLDQQMQLMHQIRPPPPTAGAPISTSNGSHISPLHQPSGWNASEHAMKLESMNPFSNGRSSMPSSGMHSGIDMVARLDAPRAMLSAQNSNNMSVMQGMNGGGGGGIIKPEAAARTIVKSESGFSNTSPYNIFGGAGNNVILEGRPNLGDASVAPFGNVVDSNSQPLNESLLDPDTTSFGFLGQIPRNFSLSDLTADFSQSTDILESYSRSPFLPPDAEDFLDSRERDPQGDNKRLDTISEGLSYEDFGSE